jgi:hypothetical protein
MGDSGSNFSLHSFISGIIMGFAAGFPSGYFLDFLRNRRTTRKERSKNIFEPLHGQLSRARVEIVACVRADSIDRNFWNQLNETGRVNEIPRPMQVLLREFLSDIIPNYEAAWRAVNEQGVQEVLEPWSKKIGTAYAQGETAYFPKYYRFLSAEKFHPAWLELRNPGTVPLWNNAVSQQRLADLGTTVDQFLRQLWSESQTMPLFQNLRDARLAALRNLSRLIPMTQKRIFR